MSVWRRSHVVCISTSIDPGLRLAASEPNPLPTVEMPSRRLWEPGHDCVRRTARWALPRNGPSQPTWVRNSLASPSVRSSPTRRLARSGRRWRRCSPSDRTWSTSCAIASAPAWGHSPARAPPAASGTASDVAFRARSFAQHAGVAFCARSFAQRRLGAWENPRGRGEESG